MNNYIITKLKVTDFIHKPKSSFVILCLIIINKIFIVLNNFHIKISFSFKEKILSIILLLSSDGEFLLSKISAYSKPIDQSKFKNISPVEIHSMVSDGAVLFYVTMVKSFQYFSKIKMNFFVHQVGSLSIENISFIKNQIPGIKIVTLEESLKEVKTILKKHQFLLDGRASKHKNRINLFSTIDIPYLTKSEHLVNIDGDIIFFKRPDKLCEWLLNKNKRKFVLHMEDHSNCQVLSERKCQELFHVSYIEKFNMGILCYPKKIFDLKSVSFFFKTLWNLDKDNFIGRDQTYFMIHLQKTLQKVQALDAKKYQVFGEGQTEAGDYFTVFNKRNKNTICCHYTSTVRKYIYKEAIHVLFKMNNLLS